MRHALRLALLFLAVGCSSSPRVTRVALSEQEPVKVPVTDKELRQRIWEHVGKTSANGDLELRLVKAGGSAADTDYVVGVLGRTRSGSGCEDGDAQNIGFVALEPETIVLVALDPDTSESHIIIEDLDLPSTPCGLQLDLDVGDRNGDGHADVSVLSSSTILDETFGEPQVEYGYAIYQLEGEELQLFASFSGAQVRDACDEIDWDVEEEQQAGRAVILTVVESERHTCDGDGTNPDEPTVTATRYEYDADLKEWLASFTDEVEP